MSNLDGRSYEEVQEYLDKKEEIEEAEKEVKNEVDKNKVIML
jgi:beta-lactam-binding protein with PASTA domain